MSEAASERDAKRSGLLLLGLLVFFRMAASPSILVYSGYLVSAGLSLLIALFLVSGGRPPWRGSSMLWAGIAVYFLAAAVSTPFSLSPALSRQYVMQQTGDLLLFLAVALAGRKSARPLAAAALSAVSLSALFALRQRLGGFEQTLQSMEVDEFARNVLTEGRVFGLTFSPDMLAASVAGVLPACLSLFIAARRPGRRAARAAVWPALALLIAALALTRSLGGFMAAAAGVAAWFILRRRHSGRPVVTARGVMVGLAALTVGVSLVIASRGGHLISAKQSENPFFLRLDNFRTGLAVFKEFPLAGAGPGQYAVASFVHRGLIGNEARHAHNLFIEAAAETGAAGAAGLALTVVGFFLTLAALSGPDRSERPEDEQDDRLFAHGLWAGAVAVFFHSLMDFSFQAPEVSAIFWIGLGLAAAFREQADDRARSRRAWIAVACLSALALAETREGVAARLRAQAAELSEKKPAQAGKTALRALAWGGPSEDMYVLLASVAAGAGKNEETTATALAYVKRAIAINPRNAFNHRYAGDIVMNGDPEAAGEYYRAAVALYPNSMHLNTRLGQWLLARGRPREAIEVLRHAARAGHPDRELNFAMGRAYEAEGEPDQAENWLKRAAGEEAPDSMVIYYVSFLARMGKTEEAISFLEEKLRKTENSRLRGILLDLQRRGP